MVHPISDRSFDTGAAGRRLDKIARYEAEVRRLNGVAEENEKADAALAKAEQILKAREIILTSKEKASDGSDESLEEERADLEARKTRQARERNELDEKIAGDKQELNRALGRLATERLKLNELLNEAARTASKKLAEIDHHADQTARQQPAAQRTLARCEALRDEVIATKRTVDRLERARPSDRRDPERDFKELAEQYDEVNGRLVAECNDIRYKAPDALDSECRALWAAEVPKAAAKKVREGAGGERFGIDELVGAKQALDAAREAASSGGWTDFDKSRDEALAAVDAMARTRLAAYELIDAIQALVTTDPYDKLIATNLALLNQAASQIRRNLLASNRAGVKIADVRVQLDKQLAEQRKVKAEVWRTLYRAVEVRERTVRLQSSQIIEDGVTFNVHVTIGNGSVNGSCDVGSLTKEQIAGQLFASMERWKRLHASLEVGGGGAYQKVGNPHVYWGSKKGDMWADGWKDPIRGKTKGDLSNDLWDRLAGALDAFKAAYIYPKAQEVINAAGATANIGPVNYPQFSGQ